MSVLDSEVAAKDAYYSTHSATRYYEFLMFCPPNKLLDSSTLNINIPAKIAKFLFMENYNRPFYHVSLKSL
jgi:hypothetical protein